MAPIKFEEQLKDKLEQRSLQPSASSWSKLAERLDAEEKTSKNPWFWWMGIAASLVIAITVLVQIFTSGVQETTPKLVEEKPVEIINKKQDPATSTTKNIEIADVNTIDDANSKIHKQANSTKQKTIAKRKPTTPLVVNNIKHESEIENTIGTQKNEDATINTVAIASALKETNAKNNTVTDREVDSLLKLASKALIKDKFQKESSRTVDAAALLEDVEEEMGQSFRSKVYEVLKEGYHSVKTAVVDRNN